MTFFIVAKAARMLFLKEVLASEGKHRVNSHTNKGTEVHNSE